MDQVTTLETVGARQEAKADKEAKAKAAKVKPTLETATHLQHIINGRVFPTTPILVKMAKSDGKLVPCHASD